MKPDCQNYIFTSERLGFRNWSYTDLAAFAALNADEEVMEHFPKPLTTDESKDFIRRLLDHYQKYGHSYYAVELLKTGEFIGFIGLAYQTYESDFTPATDIGWRLKKTAWGNGYATEGAKRCIKHAFTTLKKVKLISTCIIGNTKSENVMEKIGMTKVKTFKHPNLVGLPAYENCVLYEIKLS